jgi:uncharacterized protein (DUF433 family)
MQHSRIVWDPDIISGRPVIKGTRIPVDTILHWVAKGETADRLLVEYPLLTRDDIMAAKSYATDMVANNPVVTAAE